MILDDTGTIVRQLNGYSGARLYLMKKGSTWFVRKISQDITSNNRLQVQCAKQRNWANLPDRIIQCPKIYGDGFWEGLYFFDMEFIQGLDGVSFLASADNDDIKRFCEKILDNFRFTSKISVSQNSVPPDFLPSLYFYKLISIFDKSHYEFPLALQAKLFLRLKEFIGIGNIDSTLCHGDFTLENLIISNDGEIYACDFLDSPFEHYWQDIAKFFQDIEGGWYLRKSPPISRYVLSYIKHRIYAYIGENAPPYLKVHPVLMAINFARIIPYAQNQEDYNFIISRVAFYLDHFQNTWEKIDEAHCTHVWQIEQIPG
jgi:thiamine kinase-like enzyme